MFQTSDEYERRCPALFAAGQYDEGLRVAREGLARFPGDTGLLLSEALCLLYGGEIAGGRERFLALLQKLPRNANVLCGLMVAEVRLGLPREAANTLARLLDAPDLTPNDALSAAEELFRARQKTPAVRAYGACLRLRADDENAAMGLAATLHRAGHPRFAEGILRRLLERAPRHVQAISYLGHLRFDAGDRREAHKLWTSIPLQQHGDPRALERLMILRWDRKPLPGFSFLDIRARLPFIAAERRPQINTEVSEIIGGGEIGTTSTAVVASSPFESIEHLRVLLRSERYIDDCGRWIGGKRCFIVLGRIFGSGKGALRPFLFLALLHNQAKAAGGRVCVVTESRDHLLAYLLTLGCAIIMAKLLEPELAHFLRRWRERAKRQGTGHVSWNRLAKLAEQSCWDDFIVSEARVGGVCLRLEPLSPAALRKRFRGQSAAKWAGEVPSRWKGYLPIDEYCSDALSYSPPTEHDQARDDLSKGQRICLNKARHETDGPWRARQVFRLRKKGAYAEGRDGLVVGLGPLGGPVLRYIVIRGGVPVLSTVSPGDT